jgi:predicted ATP-grasp superfamily ATP-dependent carboligase
MPVLVLDGHSRAAVEAVQSLGRARLEIDVAAESLDCLAMRSRYVTRKLLQPSSGPAAHDFHRWLCEQDAQRNYELIVPSTETSLLSLRLLEESNSLRARAALPSNEALDIALDKNRTWQLGRELGLPAPESVLLLPANAHIDFPTSYPVVLKPLHSKVTVDGKLQTIAAETIRDENAYKTYIQKWLPHTALLRQEYISGRGVGVNFLFDHGKKVWHFLHERIHELPLSGGASSYRRSIPPMPVLLHDAEKILTALKWHGVAMVEFRIDVHGRNWLVEINPRLWGSLALAIDAGVNFPWGLWLLAQHLEIPPQPAYRSSFYTRDLRNDLQWMKVNLRADRRNPLLLTKPPFRSLLELLRPLTGRESWDHFDFHDLAVMKAVLSASIRDQLRVFHHDPHWRSRQPAPGRRRLPSPLPPYAPKPPPKTCIGRAGSRFPSAQTDGWVWGNCWPEM